MTKTQSDKIFKIFVDFDGTITKLDVGENLFRKFGDEASVKETIDNYLSEKISSKEMWLSLCKSATITEKQQLFDFIDSIEIDKTFIKFSEYCKSNNFDLYILSDGFDLYIDRILKREKLEHLKYFSNKMTINKDNELLPSFPYLDIDYKNSANCKRNHIINLSGDDEFTIFVGDGFSDRYTVAYCDFIFAKDDLLKYCEVEKITYFPYSNFLDVITRIEKLKAKKRLKKRHQAVLKRNEAYMQE